MLTNWEYRTLQFDFNGFFKSSGQFEGQEFTDEACRLGLEGWELVNTFDTNHLDGDTRFIIAVFKRPLPQKSLQNNV